MKNTFENHKLMIKEHWDAKTNRGEYIFEEPGTNIYSMRLIFRLGTIIIYGDIQPCIILSNPGINPYWLIDSLNSPDYLFAKAVAGIEKEYDPAKTKKMVSEYYPQFLNADFDDKNEIMDLTGDYEIICYSYDHANVLLEGLKAFAKQFKEYDKLIKEIDLKNIVECQHCDWKGTNNESWKHSEIIGHTVYKEIDEKKNIKINGQKEMTIGPDGRMY